MLPDHIRLKNINHITYNVKNKDAALQWYQDVWVWADTQDGSTATPVLAAATQRRHGPHHRRIPARLPRLPSHGF